MATTSKRRTKKKPTKRIITFVPQYFNPIFSESWSNSLQPYEGTMHNRTFCSISNSIMGTYIEIFIYNVSGGRFVWYERRRGTTTDNCQWDRKWWRTATIRANKTVSYPKVLSISGWVGLSRMIGISRGFPRWCKRFTLSRLNRTKIPQKGFNGWRSQRVSRDAVRNFVDRLNSKYNQLVTHCL